MAFLDFFTGIDSEQTQTDLDTTDAKLADLEADYQRRHAEQLGQAGIDERNAVFQAHQRDSHIDSVTGEVNAAFDEGLKEGAGNIRGTLGETFNKLVLTPLSIIPWQIWLVAALYLAWTSGLLKPIVAKLKPS